MNIRTERDISFLGGQLVSAPNAQMNTDTKANSATPENIKAVAISCFSSFLRYLPWICCSRCSGQSLSRPILFCCRMTNIISICSKLYKIKQISIIAILPAVISLLQMLLFQDGFTKNKQTLRILYNMAKTSPSLMKYSIIIDIRL